MAKIAGAFTVKELYELISSHSSMPSCLDLLKHSYLQAEISYLHAHVLLLEEVLLSRNQLPLTKYHALLAAQQLLFTARYPAIAFLEIYLLPVLADLCLCLARIRKEEELESYFIDRGYRESIGIRKLGQKFVRKAAAITFLAAAIKPYQNVLNSEITASSPFSLAIASLKDCGTFADMECNPRQVQALRVTFLRQLKGLNPQMFGQFIGKKLKEEVAFKQIISNSTRKLLESEDAVLTIPAINLCVSMLSDIPRHFSQKKNYLSLFSSFVRQGHVYAIIVAHNATFISEIFQEIAKMPGQQGLNAGRLIYPQVEASLQDKLEFYAQFLKCLEIWAVCLPHNEIGEVSEIAKLYVFLKEERQFVFPQLLLLRRIQEEFNQCLEAKEIQNEEILRIIEADENLMAQCAKVKSSLIELSMKMEQFVRPLAASQGSQSKSSSENKNSKSASNSQGSQQIRIKFQSLLRQATSQMEDLIYQQKVSENIQLLKSFMKEWSNLKEAYKQEISSQLIEEGDCLKQKINVIYPLYLRFKKKSLNFSIFRRRVANILGFRLEDFGLENYDDYAMDQPRLSSKSSEEESISNKTITQVSKQSSSINNLGCWSKIKPEEICKASLRYMPKNTVEQAKPESPPAIIQPIEPKIDQQCQQQPEINEYGIRQLLIKRKQYLNQSKQSIHSQASNSTPQPHSKCKSILPQSLLNSKRFSKEQSHISQKSQQHQAHNQLQPQLKSQRSEAIRSSLLKKISVSNRSTSSKEQAQQASKKKTNSKIKLRGSIGEESENENKAEQTCNMNVYQIYQIQIEGKKPARKEQPSSPEDQSQQRINHSCSLRSRLYLQKIRYSSTRKAIQQYGQKANCSNSSNKTSFNSSRTTSKSIINRQYKRISFQQYREHQSLTKGEISQSRDEMPSYGETSYNCSSENNVLNSSLFSSQSKKPKSITKVILDYKKYAEYFPKEKNQKIIKNCIKSKGLLFSSEEIEIGFVHIRKDNTLNIILYLTASKNATILNFEIISSPKLRINSDHYLLKDLKKGKQQVIKIEVSISEMPFSLPLVLIKLKPQGGESKSIEFMLPCTFNKYTHMKAIDAGRYDTSTIVSNFVQTQSIKINQCPNYHSKLAKLFSMPTQKRLEAGAHCMYECIFQSKIFILKILNEDKNTGVIIGHSPTQHTNELQFLLATLSFVLTLI